MDNVTLAAYFDGTILKAAASADEIKILCRDAVKSGFKSVCVNAVNIPLVKSTLTGSNVLICTVAGFPLGEHTTAAKVRETAEAVQAGVAEIDVVASVSRLKICEYDYYLNEIKSVKKAAGKNTLKVIIETCYLTPEEIYTAAGLCVEGGADFVKTSTGFGTRGADIRDIEIIREAISATKNKCGITREIGIKASGGIRTRQFAEQLIAAGATRLGVSGYNEILGI